MGSTTACGHATMWGSCQRARFVASKHARGVLEVVGRDALPFDAGYPNVEGWFCFRHPVRHDVPSSAHAPQLLPVTSLDWQSLSKVIATAVISFRTQALLSPEAKQLADELRLTPQDLARIANRVAEDAGAVHPPNIEYDSNPDCPGDRYFRLRITAKRGGYPLMHAAAAAARKALREAVPLAQLEFFRTAICLE